MSKLLTVFGATGNQGGALLNYVLQHPKLSEVYKLRGVTRDVTKESAVAFTKRGVEMGDMDDVESLKRILAGSYAVFSMTQFWEKMSFESEVAQGKNIADASVAAGATLIIWSSLPNVTEMTGGKLSNVHHFDSKAKVEAYIRTLSIKSVFYMPAFFMQTIRDNFKPRRDNEGILRFSLGWPSDTPVPVIDVSDTGRYIAPVLLSAAEGSPEKYHHKSFSCATAYYTADDLIAEWKKVTGYDIRYVPLDAVSETTVLTETPNSTTGLTSYMQQVMKESKGLITEYGFYGPTGRSDVQWALEQMELVGEKPTTWEEFVRANEPWFEEA